MTSLTLAGVRMERALTAARAADVDLAMAALHLMCLEIRAAHPGAETVVLDWSDQGDWLLVVEILGSAGESWEWEDPDVLASSLAGHAEGIWLPFMSPPADAAARKPTDLFSLRIDKTIKHFTQTTERSAR